VVVANCIHYAIVATAFAAQLALNHPSNLQLEGPSFWSCEALGRLPTPPKAKAGTDTGRYHNKKIFDLMLMLLVAQTQSYLYHIDTRFK